MSDRLIQKMSWFDTAGFANLAKSALKEAQKTFDKALDLESIEEKTSVTDSKEKGECCLLLFCICFRRLSS